MKLCFPRRVRVPVAAIWRRGPLVHVETVGATAGPRRPRRTLPFAKARSYATTTVASRSASCELVLGATPSSSSQSGAVAVRPPVVPMVGEAASSSSSGPRYMTRSQARARRAAAGSALNP